MGAVGGHKRGRRARLRLRVDALAALVDLYEGLGHTELHLLRSERERLRQRVRYLEETANRFEERLRGAELQNGYLLQTCVAIQRFYRSDSPLEAAWWEAWCRAYDWLPLAPQLEVLGGRYRLDFAHLPSKTAIELDGFTYHGNEPEFQLDRQRDRELAAEGWQVIRFASCDLAHDLARCLEQAQAVIMERQRGQQQGRGSALAAGGVV